MNQPASEALAEPRLTPLDKAAITLRDEVDQSAVTISPGWRLRSALLLAILADVVQMIVFPVFVEGAASPADDILDLCIGGVLTWLLGWHWEFLPSFLAKLVPGVDLVPLWTLAVANVYRKSKRLAVSIQENEEQRGPRVDSRNS
jgi:hypothetical protein